MASRIPLPDDDANIAQLFGANLQKIADGDDEAAGESVDPKEISDLLISYLVENPNPSDEEVHEWAEEMGVNIHDIEAGFYRLATRFSELFTSGKAAKANLNIDELADEIKIGMKVESEHTDDEVIQLKITLDHLVEHPQYYSRFLKPMEKAMEEDKKALSKTSSALSKEDKIRLGIAAVGGPIAGVNLYNLRYEAPALIKDIRHGTHSGFAPGATTKGRIIAGAVGLPATVGATYLGIKLRDILRKRRATQTDRK